MDTVMLVRVAISIVIGVVLLLQARKLVGQPNRKRSFQFGGAALLCFGAFNFSVGAGMEFSALQQLLALAGIGLFVAAAIALLFSIRSGERNADRARALAEASAYRAERERALAEKDAAAPPDEPKS